MAELWVLPSRIPCREPLCGCEVPPLGHLSAFRCPAPAECELPHACASWVTSTAISAPRAPWARRPRTAATHSSSIYSAWAYVFSSSGGHISLVSILFICFPSVIPFTLLSPFGLFNLILAIYIEITLSSQVLLFLVSFGLFNLILAIYSWNNGRACWSKQQASAGHLHALHSSRVDAKCRQVSIPTVHTAYEAVVAPDGLCGRSHGTCDRRKKQGHGIPICHEHLCSTP